MLLIYPSIYLRNWNTTEILSEDTLPPKYEA